MKKLLLIVLAGSCTLFFNSCNNNDTKNDDKENKDQPAVSVKGETNPLGTYVTKEGERHMEFTLQADGKGFEMYGEDKRPFTWKNKDGKIFFVYDGETTEFELPVDVAKGEIHYGSLVYKKQ